MSVLWWAEANGVFKYSSGAYRGRGNPLDAIPEPPKVGSTTSMPSKRFEETAFVATKGIGVTVPQYRCRECLHEFEYDNVNSPDDEMPKFCPNCGRRNAP